MTRYLVTLLLALASAALLCACGGGDVDDEQCVRDGMQRPPEACAPPGRPH